jgi:hypothetical protein
MVTLQKVKPTQITTPINYRPILICRNLITPIVKSCGTN